MTTSSTGRLFFVVSGEHEELPFAEIRAILNAESIPFRPVHCGPKLVILEAPENALDAVGRRSLMMQSCGPVVFESPPLTEEIMKELRDSSLPRMLEPGESFMVRTVRISGSDKRLSREGLERDLGREILARTRGTTVSLRDPDKAFLGVLSPDRFVLGLVRARRRRGEVSARRPRKRPFFHPSTMQPKLARCMVNLARARAGEILLDPFCGAGGHLIEGALIGCKVVGLDISRKMAEGAMRNLRMFGAHAEALILADARGLPVSEVDSITTDPPYGRASSTAGIDARNLLAGFLKAAASVLDVGHFMCIATPHTLNTSSLYESSGFQVAESYGVYVHRSLTRDMTVLRRGS